MLDNVDKFGYCVKCHRNLITQRVVDGRVINMFLPDHDHTEFMLNNGSVMKVCMCKVCKRESNLQDPQLQKNIMQACHKGWELEMKMLVADEKFPDWTEESGKNYLDKMSKLSINSHSENIDKTALETKSKRLSQEFHAPKEVIEVIEEIKK